MKQGMALLMAAAMMAGCTTAGTLRPNDGTFVNPSMAWAAGGVISTAPLQPRQFRTDVRPADAALKLIFPQLYPGVPVPRL
jgi:hypothetical protein